jgi:purine catabolism regulator
MASAVPSSDAGLTHATLTVAEILQLDVVRRAEPEIVAGAENLGRAVRWVHISEQPDIAEYLKGGELLLTTGMGLGGDGEQWRQFICGLVQAHVAGLLLRPSGEITDVPPELVEEAAIHGLPVIVLRHRIGFVEVTERVHGAIISHQLELLRRADQVRREFTDLVLRGVSLPRILRRLADLVKDPVILEDAAHQVVEFAGYGGETTLEGWERHSRTGHSGSDEAGLQADESCAWVPIWLRNELWGRVHVLQIDHSLDEIDLLAIDRAAAAISLALLAERDARSASDQARSALITDVLNGRLASPNEFLRRAQSLGMALQSAALAVLAIEPRGLADLVADEGLVERERQEIRAAILEHVRSAIAVHGSGCLSGLDGDRVLAIVALAKSDDPNAQLTRIGVDACERITTAWAGQITPIVGTSAGASPPTLRRALVQAGEAAAYGARVSATAGVYHYADLGIYHLLLPLADGPLLAGYVEAELSGLLDHDAHQRPPLVSTLRCFLDHDGNISRASRELFVERRTLYHRLSTIRKLLGRDLDDADTRLRLAVALRALDLLQSRRGNDHLTR